MRYKLYTATGVLNCLDTLNWVPATHIIVWFMDTWCYISLHHHSLEPTRPHPRVEHPGRHERLARHLLHSSLILPEQLRADSWPRISEWKWKWFNQAKNIRKTIKDSCLTAPWGETETNRRPCISGVLLPYRPGYGLLGHRQALHHVFCVPYLYIAWIKLERKWHHSINLCLVSKMENTLKSIKYLTMITNLWRMIALRRHWITQNSWAIFHFINCVRYKLSQNFEYIIWQDVF